MNISPETMLSMQVFFIVFMAGSYEYGAKDPFWYGMRTALAVGYSLAMYGDQRTFGNVVDWVCHALCLCQFIAVLTDLITYTPRLRRKDG